MMMIFKNKIQNTKNKINLSIFLELITVLKIVPNLNLNYLKNNKMMKCMKMIFSNHLIKKLDKIKN
jgi:hypothetical protein